MYALNAGDKMLEAKDVMTEEVFAAEKNAPIAQIKNVFLKHDIGRIVITGDEELEGIVSAWEIAKKYYQDDDIREDVKAKEIMKPITYVQENETLEKVTEKVLGNGEVIVKEKDDPVGIITKTNLVEHYANLHAGERRVKDLKTKKLIGIEKSSSAFQAIKKMNNNKIKKLIVEPEVSGILTQRDLALASKGMRPRKLVYHTQAKGKVVEVKPIIVEDLMKENIQTIPEKSDAANAANQMLSRDIGSLVTTEKDKPSGIITKTDLTQALLNLYK